MFSKAASNSANNNLKETQLLNISSKIIIFQFIPMLQFRSRINLAAPEPDSEAAPAPTALDPKLMFNIGESLKSSQTEPVSYFSH
jgi:hypothetical protein